MENTLPLTTEELQEQSFRILLRSILAREGLDRVGFLIGLELREQAQNLFNDYNDDISAEKHVSAAEAVEAQTLYLAEVFGV